MTVRSLYVFYVWDLDVVGHGDGYPGVVVGVGLLTCRVTVRVDGVYIISNLVNVVKMRLSLIQLRNYP